MRDRNVIGSGLLQADGLERGRLSSENLEAIQRIIEIHQQRVARLRWINIVAWFALLMVFATLLVLQNSQWQGFFNLFALDRLGFVIMVGLTYAAVTSWYLLRLAIKNPPSEGGMRMTDIQVRLDRIEALLERAISRGVTPDSLSEFDSARQD